MLTRCHSCETKNRLSLFWKGEPRCGKCHTLLAPPRVFSLTNQHPITMAVICLALLAVPFIVHRAGSAQRWNEEGVAFFDAGNDADAIRAYAEAVKADPDLSKAHYNMGLAYWRMGQPDQARECFRKALDSDPADTAASAMLTRASRLIAARHRRHR